jgi:transcriptional regulator of acetoin/glycerol metabolism
VSVPDIKENSFENNNVHNEMNGGMGSFISFKNLSSEELFDEIGKLLVENLQDPTEGAEQKDVFDSLEAGVVIAALKRTNGNKQAAANLLGLYRPRLYGMIKRHNLDVK